MKSISIILAMMCASTNLLAGEIHITGSDGLKYRGSCENMVGQKFEIKGSVPTFHMIASRRPFIKCRFLKSQRTGVLRISVDQSLNDGATVYLSQDRGRIFEIPNGRLAVEIKLATFEVNEKGEQRPYESNEEFRKPR